VTDFTLNGITRNPWTSAHAGGSSGGAGAAVAAGLGPIAIGTTAAARSRHSVELNGLVGLKARSAGCRPGRPR